MHIKLHKEKYEMRLIIDWRHPPKFQGNLKWNKPPGPAKLANAHLIFPSFKTPSNLTTTCSGYKWYKESILSKKMT